MLPTPPDADDKVQEHSSIEPRDVSNRPLFNDYEVDHAGVARTERDAPINPP